MKFSVFQVSRKGGREKNEDRMGYCYTRESGLFVLADGMGGHPEGEVAAQLALQTHRGAVPEGGAADVKDVAALPDDAVMAGAPPDHALRQRKGHARHAAHHASWPRDAGHAANWVHCGDSRLYLVRDDELITRTRDHSYSEQQQTLARSCRMDERVNRNMLFTCLGSPTQAGVRHHRPAAAAAGRPHPAVLRRPVGQLERQRHRDAAGAASRSPTRCPTSSSRRCATAARKSDNVTVIALEWETPDGRRQQRGVSTDSISDGVFASTIQAGMPRTREPDDLDDDAIERSIAEINEAIQRSRRRKKPEPAPAAGGSFDPHRT